jgi:TRAP-type C4-dicarboxylate transport system permease small subunit
MEAGSSASVRAAGWIGALVSFIQALTAVLLLVAVALNFANIVGRYVFSAPIASAEEVMLFLLVGIVFLGNSVVGY